MAAECGIVTNLTEKGWSDDEEQPAVSGCAEPELPGSVSQEYPDIFIDLESSSEEWFGFYAKKKYHVIAVQALDDPASRQVGRDHPGTHRVILEAAAANALMQRYV